jgi:Bacterial DNA-binding protein
VFTATRHFATAWIISAARASSGTTMVGRERLYRAARMGRNPATGEPIKIKASRKVAFRAAKDLKLAI